MATPISFRPNDDDLRNLAVLEAGGASPTEAIRAALAADARRCRQQRSLAAEARRLADDEVDRAVLADVRAFLGDRFDDLPA